MLFFRLHVLWLSLYRSKYLISLAFPDFLVTPTVCLFPYRDQIKWARRCVVEEGLCSLVQEMGAGVTNFGLWSQRLSTNYHQRLVKCLQILSVLSTFSEQVCFGLISAHYSIQLSNKCSTHASLRLRGHRYES